MTPEVKELLIDDPMIVAKKGNRVIIISRSDALESPIDPSADSQLYSADSDNFTPVLPLASYPKFIDGLELVDPPAPFVRKPG